jgi:hypothetical protein
MFSLFVLLATAANASPRKKPSFKRIYVRGVVAAYVEPQITTRNLQLEPTGIAGAAVPAGALDDSGVRVAGSSSPTAIVGYVVPGLPWRLSVETMVSTPSTLKIEATGRLANESIAPEAAGYTTGIPPLGRDLAEAAMSAPIISIIARPLRIDRFSMFAGVGASVMLVYNAHVTNSVLTEVNQPSLAITHAFGAVVQAGIEGKLWGRWVARLDAKYINYGEQHARLDRIQVKTQIPGFDTVDVGAAKLDVSIHPIILQAGIGADF